MKRLSLTNRLTLLFALTSAAMLLGLGLVVNTLVERHFAELDTEALTGKLELARNTLAKVRSRADMETLPQQLNAALVGHPGMALVIRWPDAATLITVSGEDSPAKQLMQTRVRDDATPVRQSGNDGKPYLRMAATAPLEFSEAPPAIVDIALDISHHEHFISNFQFALWLIVILAAVVSGILGRFAVRKGLEPLRAINHAASAITANRLDQRLRADTVPVELEELVHTLNMMLGRLEESFQRLSDYSSDLAHELRTPVSNMLMQTQVILSKERSADEYREILYSNMEEFTRLSRMIADMLFLAKSEHGLVAPFNETVDIGQEVRDLFSFFEVLAEGKNLALVLDGEGHVHGDRMLLRRAISNVLSNAIRHSTAEGEVVVNLKRTDDDALAIRITNRGDTIAQEHIPRLFDRFYRADSSRHGSAEGAGLGLAITKSIFLLHGGSISVESRDGVTCFELRLPPNRVQDGNWTAPHSIQSRIPAVSTGASE
ncbi:heavy metal sensor histidine kinase [Noviherbaspirillum sp. ST9]|uniref:heavy metal sensor histidine kinase n=1 Tax=Noviherbaspirillum sp. ST9 TaxID=3401606 RepID=UPI003B5891C0